MNQAEKGHKHNGAEQYTKSGTTLFIAPDTSKQNLKHILNEAGYMLNTDELNDIYSFYTSRHEFRRRLMVGELIRRYDDNNIREHTPFHLISCRVNFEYDNGVRNACAFIKYRTNGEPIESRQVRAKVSEKDACILVAHRALSSFANVQNILVMSTQNGNGEQRVDVTLEHGGRAEKASMSDPSLIMAFFGAYFKALNQLYGQKYKRSETLPYPFASQV